MVSVFRYHEISESSHRIMNPLSVDKLRLLGDVCRIAKGTRLLDLACGKGEMLCLFARDLGTSDRTSARLSSGGPSASL